MQRIVLVPATLALLCASMAFAERRSEDASAPERNATWWTESESGRPSGPNRGKCTIDQSGGKVRVSSLAGRGGAASYQSRWSLDWTDSFTIVLEHGLESGIPPHASRSATAGLALGFGNFSAASGWRDGVSLQVRRTNTARQLQLVLRRNGNVVSTAAAPLSEGAHSYRLAWRSVGGQVSLDVFVDGSGTPLLELDGLASVFGNRRSQGVGVAMFGTSTGNFPFESTFDNLLVSGDDFDDSDDSQFDDDDGAEDDDEDGIEGNDEDEDEDDDDDDDGDDEDDDDDGDDDGDDDDVTLATGELSSAAAVAAFPVLEAEVERSNGVTLVKLLEWDAAEGRMVRQKVLPGTNQVIETTSFTPTAAQLAEWQDEINVLSSLGVDLAAALAQVGVESPGAGVEEIELDVRLGVPSWEVEYRTAAGAERETRIVAS